MSLLGALTPLGKGARGLWFRSVLAYTAGGFVSATLTGMALGLVGRWLGVGAAADVPFYFISILALIIAAGEWGWICFRLPERKLQTEKFWAHEFGFIMASAMWGLHIGLGFATRVTYGGFWLLVTVALAMGDPTYGSILMLVYWLGRALPVWVAPALVGPTRDATELPEAILEHGLMYHRVVALASVWSGGIALLFALAAPTPSLLKFFASLLP